MACGRVVDDVFDIRVSYECLAAASKLKSVKGVSTSFVTTLFTKANEKANQRLLGQRCTRSYFYQNPQIVRRWREIGSPTTTGKGKCPYTTFSFRLAQSRRYIHLRCLQFCWLLLVFDTAPQKTVHSADRRKPAKATSAAIIRFPLFLRAAKMPVLQLGTKCAAALSPEQLRKQDLVGCRKHHLHLLRYYLTLA